MNYYNEFDSKAAAWIQQLIDDKQIPYGYVDSRSILEVQPSDLSGFIQCHFFAGIGGWSLALRLAGWPADRQVWTASLPCQPFSTAGKQLGTDDERHLAPTFLELVRKCRPATLVGEQVASKLARTDWLPGIRLELEALGYSFGAADLCAPCAGETGEGRIVRGDQESWERVIIGAPHIRQRLYWVADAYCERHSGIDPLLRTQEGGTDGARHLPEATGGCKNGTDRRMGDSISTRECGRDQRGFGAGREKVGEQQDGKSITDESRNGREVASGLEKPRNLGAGSLSGETSGCGGGTVDARSESIRQAHGAAGTGGADPRSASSVANLGLPDPVRGGREMEMQPEQASGCAFEIRQADVLRNSGAPQLLPCRDGKTRRTESGIFPLVDGLPRGVVPSGDPSDPSYANGTAEARAVRLKGYGNAIQIDTAILFIKSYMEAVTP